jgi:eukaryotic-like serine/threonine-protein kinase
LTISPGFRLGPYEVVSLVGAGGMGEVYKARDTRLDRTVAIKVLSAALALDPDFRVRFDREARAISQLSHPHICALYDVGEYQGSSFLVMEHLAGETLASRLDRGPMKPPDTVSIAIQIADALAAAHRAGIVHRDLKPANVFLVGTTGSSGVSSVKLLDFGLAKSTPAIAFGAGAEAMSVQPTISRPLTQQGTILGTFQYMAPEQIEGADADARSDVWALGCVLYEMLTGTRAFSGRSHASLIANILNIEPPAIAQRQPLVSPVLDHIVRRCLEKDRESRWQSMADVARELRWAAAPAATGEAPVRTTRSIHRRTAAWAIAVAIAGAGATAVAMMILRAAPAPRTIAPMKLTLVAPQGLALTPFGSAGTPHFALSPDGRQIAFVAAAAGRAPSLWIRPLDSRGAREIPGSDDASSPFWASDGHALGFFADGKVKTIPLEGERPSTLATVAGGAAGGAWAGDVVLLGHATGPITRVSASGGAVRPATVMRPTAGGGPVLTRGHQWPQFLPDGRHFIYTETTGAVMLASLDSTASEEILNPGGTAIYSAAGFLLFVPQSSTKLMAQRVDPKSYRPIGAPAEWLDPVRYAAGSGFPPVSVSAHGLAAYWDGTSVSTALEWFDREGNALRTLPAPSQSHIVAIAPEGRQVAYTRIAPGATNVSIVDQVLRDADIWLMDAAGGTSRFSFTPGGATGPIWSRDGREILFTSVSDGLIALFRRPTSGTERERLVGTVASTNGATLGNYRATDWTADRRTALISTSGATSARDIAAFSLETHRVTPLFETAAFEIQGRFSPDDRWIAYASNETGRWEVFVESFPPSGSRWQVSTDGGSQPIWHRDGRELFFSGARPEAGGRTGDDGRHFLARDPARAVRDANEADLPAVSNQLRRDAGWATVSHGFGAARHRPEHQHRGERNSER